MIEILEPSIYPILLGVITTFVVAAFGLASFDSADSDKLKIKEMAVTFLSILTVLTIGLSIYEMARNFDIKLTESQTYLMFTVVLLSPWLFALVYYYSKKLIFIQDV